MQKQSRRSLLYFTRRTWRRIGMGIVLVIMLGWALTPAFRTVELLVNFSNRQAPSTTGIPLPLQSVSFPATDGVRIAGWFVRDAAQSPTVIVLPGYRDTRVKMLPWAKFLFAAHFNVLMIDARGTGASDGWVITMGAQEPRDVNGAVAYLDKRSDLTNHTYGILGVSMGSGVAILTAAANAHLRAIVADSPWTDYSALLSHDQTVMSIPVLPYESWLIQRFIGVDPATIRPIDVVGKLAPRPILVIHALDDRNANTTPLDANAIIAAANQPKLEFVVPNGGHIGALVSHPTEYIATVVAFLRQYLLTIGS